MTVQTPEDLTALDRHLAEDAHRARLAEWAANKNRSWQDARIARRFVDADADHYVGHRAAFARDDS